MLPARGRLEVLIVATALGCLLTAVLWRVGDVQEDVFTQRVSTLGAHFRAGIALLQARSRVQPDGPLNNLGYPTGPSGRISGDADCAKIWARVMADEAAAVVVRYVPDGDGSGDRCEYALQGDTPSQVAVAQPGRIVYWPQGSSAGVVTIGRRAVRVHRGEHVLIDLG